MQKTRAQGCLLGLAVGDALGTTLEFKPPGTFEPLTDLVGGGPFGLQPGQWTDDTSMALCLAESLVEAGGFDAKDQMQRYCRWYRQGHLSATGTCFDIGNTCRDALHRFEDTGEALAGSTDPRSAGNGSIMRLAPVAIRWAHDLPQAAARAADSSRTTHGAPEAVDACRLLCTWLVGAMQNSAPGLGQTSKQELLDPQSWPLSWLLAQKKLAPKIEAIARGSYADKSPPEIRGSGYVVESLEAAMWAFATTDSFEEGALAAVNLGDDADTTGAVYGQIAGAFYGVQAIPPQWLSQVAKRAQMDELLQGLMMGSVCEAS